MKGKSYSVWIEAEHWAGNEGTYEDNNIDVFVKFEDGTEWNATFITYKNIYTLSEKNAETGEYLNGRYFWTTDMILVKTIQRKYIKEVIDELINSEDFERIFSRSDEE